MGQYFGNCSVTIDDNITELAVDDLDLDEVTYDVTSVIDNAACYTLDFARQYEDATLEICMVFYHIFMYLWTIQFIHAVMICIVAGAICDWYWTRPSGSSSTKGGDGKWGDPVCRSCCRTFRF